MDPAVLEDWKIDFHFIFKPFSNRFHFMDKISEPILGLKNFAALCLYDIDYSIDKLLQLIFEGHSSKYPQKHF